MAILPDDAQRAYANPRERLARLGLTMVRFAQLAGVDESTARRAVRRPTFVSSVLGRLMLAMERDPSLIAALRAGCPDAPAEPWDGRPPHPDRDGEHVLMRRTPAGSVPMTAAWSAEFQTWHIQSIFSPAEVAGRGVTYCHPLGSAAVPANLPPRRIAAVSEPSIVVPIRPRTRPKPVAP